MISLANGMTLTMSPSHVKNISNEYNSFFATRGENCEQKNPVTKFYTLTALHEQVYLICPSCVTELLIYLNKISDDSNARVSTRVMLFYH